MIVGSAARPKSFLRRIPLPKISLPPAVRAWAVIAILVFVAGCGAIVFSGTRFGAALALLAGVGPIAVLCALRAPLLFPFGLLVLLVPFDNLLVLKSFGTLTKLLALASDVALIAWYLRTRLHVTPSRALICWLGFAVLAAASFTWAPQADMGIPMALSVGSLMLLYAFVSFMPLSRKTLEAVIGMTVAGATIAGAYGAYLFHRGVDVGQDGRLMIASADGSGSIDPNHFAAAILTPLVICIVAMLYAKRPLIRFGAAACAVLMTIGILVSQSRGAMVAAAVMFLYLIVRSRKRVVLGGIALAGIALSLTMIGQIAARFNQISATGGAGRLGIWRVAFAAFKMHPLFGVGIGNFDVAYNDAFLTVPAFVTMKVIEGAHLSVAPHSNLVWIAVELGALGLLAMLFAWWMQFRSLHVIPEDHRLHPLRLAMEAAIVGMFVCGLFLGTLNYKYLWLTFMLAALTRNVYETELRYSS